MAPSGRFKRIAEDLEKLPCELHEGVLVDLEFEQLIRLSLYAGPGLLLSLENSPSTWGKFFRGGMGEWQILLALTDQARKRCFKTLKSKDGRPGIFRYPSGTLAFVHYRSLDWNPYYASPARHLRGLSRKALMQYWLEKLSCCVIDASKVRWDQDYDHSIEPWVPRVDGAAEIFRKARAVPLSIEELAKFFDVYQQIRTIRAEALAAELYRLANLYETHPNHLKEPFAPESPRPNEKHVPFQMRSEARQLVRRATNTWWGKKQSYPSRFRYAFPAIVPYARSVGIFKNGTEELKQSKCILPMTIMEKSEAVYKAWPDWAMDNDAYAQVYSMKNARNDVGHIRLAALGRTNYPHSEIDLRWTENIVEVVAWMKENLQGTPQQEDGGIALKAE